MLHPEVVLEMPSSPPSSPPGGVGRRPDAALCLQGSPRLNAVSGDFHSGMGLHKGRDSLELTRRPFGGVEGDAMTHLSPVGRVEQHTWCCAILSCHGSTRRTVR